MIIEWALLQIIRLCDWLGTAARGVAYFVIFEGLHYLTRIQKWHTSLFVIKVEMDGCIKTSKVMGD